jgi:hypothetical protein
VQPYRSPQLHAGQGRALRRGQPGAHRQKVRGVVGSRRRPVTCRAARAAGISRARRARW